MALRARESVARDEYKITIPCGGRDRAADIDFNILVDVPLGQLVGERRRTQTGGGKIFRGRGRVEVIVRWRDRGAEVAYIVHRLRGGLLELGEANRFRTRIEA